MNKVIKLLKDLLNNIYQIFSGLGGIVAGVFTDFLLILLAVANFNNITSSVPGQEGIIELSLSIGILSLAIRTIMRGLYKGGFHFSIMKFLNTNKNVEFEK